MTRSKKEISLHDQLIQEIERSLCLGRYIEYKWNSFFIDKLEDVHEDIITSDTDKLSPEDQVNLIEVFIAGALEKAEEIDDSDDDLGMFIDGLFDSLFIALRRLDITSKDLLKRVLTWKGRDEYGYCDGLGEEIIDVLNSEEIFAYRKIIEKHENHSDTERNILKGLYKKDHDIDAYIQLCKTTQWNIDDFYEVAILCERKEQNEEALDWVSRALLGIDLGKYSYRCSKHEMEKLERTILTKLGRKEEAFEKAWDKFISNPSEYTYRDVTECFLSDASKEEWYNRALEIIKGCSVRERVIFYSKFNEVELLANLILKATDEQLEELSHYQTEPIAEALRSPYPLVAAKLFQALGMRIVNNKKSKYYHNSVEHLYEAKLLYEVSRETREVE